MQTLLLIILVIAISSILYILLKPQQTETKKVFNAEYFRGLNYLLNNDDLWVNKCHKRYIDNKATQNIRKASDGLDFAAIIDELAK